MIFDEIFRGVESFERFGSFLQFLKILRDFAMTKYSGYGDV
jgi:hypothetical protein